LISKGLLCNFAVSVTARPVKGLIWAASGVAGIGVNVGGNEVAVGSLVGTCVGVVTNIVICGAKVGLGVVAGDDTPEDVLPHAVDSNKHNVNAPKRVI
jgi:hypothetical protein